MEFLEKVVKDLVNKHGEEISDLCIVLPNKRAGLFLKKHLSKYIHKATWLPPLIGAEEFVEKTTEFEIIDNTHLLFELYAVYSNTVETPDPFEEFNKWGNMLLHDFNEIDRYLIDAEKLYNHVNEARAIEVWNLGEEPSAFQLKYIAFWRHMKTIYFAFHEHLKSKNQTYQGAAFRKVAENLIKDPASFIHNNVPYKEVVFVGFNALTKAEESVISTLKKHGKASIFWDADNYYLNDKYQESGLFLREFKKKEIFTPFNFVSDKFHKDQKSIEIIGIPQNVGQAKFLSTLFSDEHSDFNYEDTAIVLSDENLLIPVLQSIPVQVNSINVTMGYPLKHTPLNNFFEHFLKTVINAERYGKKDALTYHYKDLLIFFETYFSKRIFGDEACLKIRDLIAKNNWVFITGEKLSSINTLLQTPLQNTYSIPNIITSILTFIEKLKTTASKEKENQIEREVLFMFAKLFKQVKELTLKYPFITSTKSFYSLYKQLLSSYNLDLYGEPLKGLQVMGVLETRNIDFKRVILLSTNEGILPAGKSFNSFIPFDIKKAYKLPTHVEKDAVYAYHFYRLIQNAEHCSILYNTETSEFNSGEQSRFITQIENELNQDQFKNITLNKKIISYPSIPSPIADDSIVKSEKIMSKIGEILENGLSPTALNTYINCPKDFYFKYIIGVREEDEVEESVSASTFGDILHQVLENLYLPFNEGSKNLTEADISEMMKLVDKEIMKEFSKKMSEREIKSGKNFITFNIAKELLITFLKNEKHFLNDINDDLFIQGLEKELTSQLLIDSTNVKIKGKVDRIDTHSNQVRIIDYKTGFVDFKNLSLSSFDELLEKTEKSKAFQVMMYAYLYSKNNDISSINLSSGNISFRKLSNQFMPVKINKDHHLTKDIINDFETLLTQLIKELLNPNLPFQHKHDAQYCKYCTV